MKIVFTLCSNNYLAQAKTLGDSLLRYNSDYIFIIGLVDKKRPEIDYDFFIPYQIIEVEELNILNFDSLRIKYNIIELNTCVKASYFKYLIQKYPQSRSLFYFDPDIQIFNNLILLETALIDNDILLTPHITTPISLDNYCPSENLFLNHGLYNLGFIGINPSSYNVIQMLEWWEERTLKLGFDNVDEGFFVDQLWINLVPIYFKEVKILREFGYNAAPWNLHERKNIRGDNGVYSMEDGSILTFYHFSSYKYTSPENISVSYTRFGFDECNSVINKLYSDYHTNLLNNNIAHFSNLICYYQENQLSVNKGPVLIKSPKVNFKLFLKLLIPPFLFILLKKIKSIY